MFHERKIYVASSWRNERQSDVVKLLRAEGHDVYDFKNPEEGKGFHWSDIDPKWKDWSPSEFRARLEHPLAIDGFDSDFSAMEKADTCVLVMPCGRSAHLEAGWFIGAGKRCIILLSDGEPELMYKMARVCTSAREMLDALQEEHRFYLLECVCHHSFVRSDKLGSGWSCPKCGEVDDVDNITDATGPERSLTAEEANAFMRGRKS